MYTNVYALAQCMFDEGISVAVPPPPFLPKAFFKLPRVRPRPLQRRILGYLSQGGSPSINAIATSLRVWRSSVQRSLKAMKREGSVKDQWVWFASNPLPKIKAHTFHITDWGRRELKFLQSTANPTEPIPLGWRILLLISHGNLVTIGPIAKITGKPQGHIRRVMKSLQNKGLVDCLYSKMRISFGQDLITHLHRITDLGRKVLEAGPEAYLRTVRSPRQSMRRSSSMTPK